MEDRMIAEGWTMWGDAENIDEVPLSEIAEAIDLMDGSFIKKIRLSNGLSEIDIRGGKDNGHGRQAVLDITPDCSTSDSRSVWFRLINTALLHRWNDHSKDARIHLTDYPWASELHICEAMSLEDVKMAVIEFVQTQKLSDAFSWCDSTNKLIKRKS